MPAWHKIYNRPTNVTTMWIMNVRTIFSVRALKTALFRLLLSFFVLVFVSNFYNLGK
jgi:hypothetical protein